MEIIMKKKVLSVIMLIIMLSLHVSAEDITILIDGETLASPVAAQIVNDRTMLPMRAIFEKLGAEVTWFGEDKIIFATKHDTLIVMKIGDLQMSVQKTGTNQNRVTTLDTAPYIDNDYTYVPVRAIAEALDANVDWNAETRTVSITK